MAGNKVLEGEATRSSLVCHSLTQCLSSYNTVKSPLHTSYGQSCEFMNYIWKPCVNRFYYPFGMVLGEKRSGHYRVIPPGAVHKYLLEPVFWILSETSFWKTAGTLSQIPSGYSVLNSSVRCSWIPSGDKTSILLEIFFCCTRKQKSTLSLQQRNARLQPRVSITAWATQQRSWLLSRLYNTHNRMN